MRRFLPVLIVIIGVVALIIDFWPGLKLPDFGNPEGGSRPVETKLGLDLSGGLRVEYQALPAGGKVPSQGDLSTIKDIIERRVNATGVSEPLVQTQGSDRIVVEIRRRERPRLHPQAHRCDRTARLRPAAHRPVRLEHEPGTRAGGPGSAAPAAGDPAALQR